jgi:hypothetical protein
LGFELGGDDVVGEGRVRIAFFFYLYILHDLFVFFLLVVTVLKLLHKVEDGLYLLLFMTLLPVLHVPLYWLELSELEYQLRQTYIGLAVPLS